MRALAILVLLAACNGSTAAPPSPRDAAALFGNAPAHAAPADPWAECAQCHGPGGHGDGPMAAGLPAKPRDLADPAWQQVTSDDAIAKVIVSGGAAVGKSGAMPPHPNLDPDQVRALVARVRGMR